jgi:hypothetical protein
VPKVETTNTPRKKEEWSDGVMEYCVKNPKSKPRKHEERRNKRRMEYWSGGVLEGEVPKIANTNEERRKNGRVRKGLDQPLKDFRAEAVMP